MKAIVRGLLRRVSLALFVVFAAAGVHAQTPADPTAAATSTNDQMAALQLQLTNAWHQVELIVNQPAPAFRREPGYQVAIYGPGGWFHPGANTPDFNIVDVRHFQQFDYKEPWVSSDVTPTLMFRGSDLEFNSMTKLFYTNRSLPKKRLSEAEMLQINSLYRTIGHCQAEISQLQPPPPVAASQDTQDGQDAQSDTNDAAPPKAIVAIERIPQQTRILYGSIGIGTLIVVVIALRFIKKKPESE
ncbi:MAG TPA: hypothetical protein VMH87_16135 [Pseudomonadales bacterium]|nr:hypothetical protein [Pseudomonadales bacterium]